MLIKLKQYFRGRITNERLLYPIIYNTDTLAPELVTYLLNHGYAEVIFDEPLLSSGENEPVADDSSTVAVPPVVSNRKRRK